MSVIDDEPDIMYLFKDALSQMKDFRLFGFTDSMLALEHFIHNRSNYRLILSDYRIPGLNGIQLLKYVKKLIHQLKLCLLVLLIWKTNSLKSLSVLTRFYKSQLVLLNW
jgi:DNA-binding NtrC family response regulator